LTSPEDSVPPTAPQTDARTGTTENPSADAAARGAADSDARLREDLRNLATQGGEAIGALQRTLEAAQELLLAEAALAREASLRIAALALIASILLLGGWLCLMTALALWLQSMGLSPLGAAAAVAALSLLLGALALWRAAGLAPLLGFPRSRRQLERQGQAP
jgi:hypothetical protein